MLSPKLSTISWRPVLLLTIAATATLLALAYGPITQAEAYHQFADQRALFGIPNFWNVISNAPFLGVGLYGLNLWARGYSSGPLAYLRPAYATFFSGVALVAFGSAYYHLNPNTNTLIWDRLPMTIAFMAFFVALLAEHIQAHYLRYALLPSLAAGVFSVLWWYLNGDLRPYILIQFLPMLIIPVLVVIYPSRQPRSHWVWYILIAYTCAKFLEQFDISLHNHIGVSGHTLKHLAAALGAYGVAAIMHSRKPCNKI